MGWQPASIRPSSSGSCSGIPFTPEQPACITAPLEPGVIVAGAGSGKTTVMAARVVWLVGTGQVAPEQVLGLTFTNKAAAELCGARPQGPARPARRTVRPARRTPSRRGVGEPTRLHLPRLRRAADQGARPAARPGAARPAARRRHPLPARGQRVLRPRAGPFPALTKVRRRWSATCSRSTASSPSTW